MTPVVVTHGSEVLVVDPRSGETVSSFQSQIPARYGLGVARTTDGFIIRVGGSRG